MEGEAHERAVGTCGPPKLLPELSRALLPVPVQGCTPTSSHEQCRPHQGEKQELPGPRSDAGGIGEPAAKAPAWTFTLPQEKVGWWWLPGRRGDIC